MGQQEGHQGQLQEAEQVCVMFSRTYEMSEFFFPLPSMALPIGWSLAEKLVFNKIKEKLGFQRCKIFVVGSAPTRQEVHEFFMSYDMPLMELYGKAVMF